MSRHLFKRTYTKKESEGKAEKWKMQNAFNWR